MTATKKPPLVLPPMDETTWVRMGWRGQQQWLRVASALRRQILADVNARLAQEASHAAHRRAHDELCDEVARAQRILDGLPIDPDGPKRLHALGEAVARSTGARSKARAA